MPKVIQNNNQTLSNNVNSNNSNNKSSNGSTSSHFILSSVFARLVSLLSSFILVLRHGLKKIKEFLGLFPYLRTLFPWRSSTFIKRSRQIRIVAFISCFAFVLLSFTILHPLSSPTQPTEAATGSSQSSSLTLDLASSSASVDLLVTDPEGSFAVSSSNAEFNVTTNNFTGYTLSIMSSNDEGLLTSTNGSSLSSITSAISLDTFAASTSYNGKWGYRPSVYNAAANTSFLPSPTTTASTLDTTTAPNTSTPNYYTIEIGVRSDYTTASSSYTNTFIITAVSNPINYTISYDSNTNDNVTNMPTTQSSSTMATNIVLSSDIPVRDGYDFMGWCTVAPDTTTPETCTGTTFQPGGDFGIDQTTLNNTTLYAMWQSQGIRITYDANGGYFNNNPAQTTSIISYTVETSTETKIAKTSNISDDGVQDGGYGDNVENIQTVSFPGASSLKVTVTYQTESTGFDWLAIYDGSVTPTRTNYADSITGKLGGTTKVENAVFTIPGDTAQFYFRSDSSNSNYYGYYAQVQADAIITPNAELQTPTRPGYTFVGWYTDAAGTTGNEFTPNANMESGTTVYAKWLKDLTVIFNGNGNTGGSMANQTITYGNNTLNTNAYTKSGYTFTGWNTKADGSGTTYKDRATYSYTSPTDGDTITLYAQWLKDLTIIFNGNGNTGGSMASQIITYGNNTLNKNTYTKSGDYVFTGWNTKADGSGTAYKDGATYRYTSSIGSDTLTLYAQWATNLLDDVTYMQDLTATQCSGSYDGATATLIDKRDNSDYTVAKINGNCWMTQNLRLSGGRTLTSADSNVASSWSFPSTELAGNSYSYTAPQSTISSNTSYGGYYNFCAASAGTNCQSSKRYDTTYDICPKGWRLPTNSEQRGITSYSSAFSPVYSGYYDYGSLSDTGSRGYWWSSTAYNYTNQYRLYYSSGSLATSYYLNKSDGGSVRCVRSS